MSHPVSAPVPFFDRLLAPRVFLAGLIGAFVACCLLGRFVATTNPFEAFVRFHAFLSNQTHFYPTATQVLALCRDGLAEDQVAVIIGGNSVLFGTGQPQERIWSSYLEMKLGPNFRVRNLARPGALPPEFGAVAAEMLSRVHPRVIYVTVQAPFTGAGPDAFETTYSSFFWDAYHKGLLAECPQRESAIAEFRRDAFHREELRPGAAERDRGCSVDRFLRFQDLWTHVAYRQFGTVYTPALGSRFLKPRRTFQDPHGEIPIARREATFAADMKIVRSCTQAASEAGATARRLATSMPAVMRPSTLFLVIGESPYFRHKLTDEERKAYDSYFSVMPRELEGHGFSAVVMGEDFTSEDFGDRCHLAPVGGRKLADEAAPVVKMLARKLGYLSKEGDG